VTGWLLLLAVFVVVLNPGAVAQIVSSGTPASSPGNLAGKLAPGFGIALSVLALAALLSESILDLLDLSLSTFQIAAGVLVVFGALLAFVGPGPRPEDRDQRERLWLNIALLVWLVSPPPVALAIAVGVDEGPVPTILAAGIALAVAVGPAVLRARWTAERSRLVVVWTTRLLAGVAAVAAIDLIRRGVENV
jgi:small neutral amino acid transporter SnatA (MarC family)